MKNSSRSARFVLCATTALTFAGGIAAAQTTQTLNLGSVVATGNAQPAAAPSATGSLKQAQELKKLVPNIISVQPQSQIQKLPDVNIAEALQRVPGISMESDTGQGRFVNIRGMDADLNGTSYDGVHLTAANQSTPTGGGRAVAFDAFPTGMIGGVEVIKSLTPDLDAEGLGGSINLLPLQAPADGGPLVNISAAGGEETLRRTGIFQDSVTLADSFAIPGMRSFTNDKPFSVITNYTYHSDRRGIDDVEEDYPGPTGGGPSPVSDLQFRHYDGHRVTQGLGVEFDFNPSPITGLYLRAMSGGYDESLDKNRLEIDGLDDSNGTLTDNGGGNYTVTDATAQKDFTNSNERINYQLAAFGGKTVIANTLNVDFRGAWTQGLDVVTRNYSTKFKDPHSFLINYSTASADYRSFSTPGVDLSNPASFKLSKVTNSPGRNIDSEFSAAANASFADNILGNVGEGKFGFSARFRTEGSLQQEFDYAPADKGALLSTLDQGNPNVTYYNSHYTIGPDVSYNNLFPQIGAPTSNIETTLGSFAHNSENVYAGYGQETLEVGPVEILGGVRVEVTQADYGAYLNEAGLGGPIAGAIYFSGDDTNYLKNHNKQNYTNVFPSLQIKYAANDQLQFRAAYSTGIARPGFQQISAADSVVIGGASNGENAVTQGNPSLKPTTENAFDLTAEYYTNHDGLLSINPFYKIYSNYVVSTQAEGTFQGQPAVINSYENIGGAFARGLELDAQQKLTMLPTPLNGFGLDGNITFVDSRGRYDTDANNNPLKANELPETSPITYNATVFYEKGPVEFRLASTYVSRNLFTVVAGGRSLDQFSSPRFRLDLSAAYHITPEWQVFAEGKNLTNTKLEFTQSASSAYPIQREYYESDYIVGARYAFGG